MPPTVPAVREVLVAVLCSSEELQDHLARHPSDWPVIHLGLKHQSQVFKDYCAVMPSYIIIGPQGRIRAADDFGGDRLHKAVTEIRSQSP